MPGTAHPKKERQIPENLRPYHHRRQNLTNRTLPDNLFLAFFIYLFYYYIFPGQKQVPEV
jgi:hypothetical protein